MPKAHADVYQIPGFSRYEVRTNIIVEKATGNEIEPRSMRGNYQYVHITNDRSITRTYSYLRILALAYHGYHPLGQAFYAHHWGGELNKKTVVWLPARTVIRLRKGKLSQNHRHQIREEYWNLPVTMKKLATQHGVSLATISRIIAEGYRN